MDKPHKPRSGGIAGFFSGFFPKKQKPSYPSAYNPARPARPSATISTGQNMGENPAGKFRTLTSNPESNSQQPGLNTSPVRAATRPLASQNETSEAPAPVQPVSLPMPPQPPKPPSPPNVARVSQRKFFDPGKILPAFWTIASLLSITVNIVLIVALILLGRELFVLKSMVGNKLLGGLYENFIYMDQAHIKTDITVSNDIPINFTLPIEQDTVVVLTQNTPINGAHVVINTGGISINSSANIVLPAGTNLPVHLSLQVPVSASVPVKLDVPVDIPLQNTDLHKPFIGLQQVVSPFYYLLQPQMKGPEDLPLCWPNSALCTLYFK